MHSQYSFTISLRIWHPDLGPSQITRNLGLHPRIAHEKGQERRTPSGRPLGGVYETSFWTHSFDLPNGTDDVEEIIYHVASVLEGHSTFLNAINQEGGRSELFIGLFMNNANTGFELRHPLISFLRDIGLGISLDIYAPDVQ